MSMSVPFSWESQEIKDCLGAKDQALEENQACIALFNRYSEHYQRKRLETSPRTRASDPTTASRRFLTFLDSLAFVDQHNSDPKNSHRVTLNAFSDIPHDQVIQRHGLVGDDGDVRRRLFDSEKYQSIVDNWNSATSEAYVRLNSEEMVLQVAADLLGIGKGSMNHLKPKHEFIKHKQHTTTQVTLPVAGQQQPFKAPLIEQPGLDGLVLKVKKAKNDDKGDYPTNQPTDQDDTGDKFEYYLDWATTHNPDGVSIVHPAIDQGKCGSCWAKAATGSLEASAARREAYFTYTGYHSSHKSTADANTTDQQAIASARAAENRAMGLLKLSIQELLDCDSAVDQGCTGGNPLLAFYFIHRYGLTSEDNYPYTGSGGICRDKLVRRPIASVKSWGILPPNHEDHMELVLRYIGPIAVGFNAAERSFLSYSGGIYDPKNKCHQSANHALLITGFGEKKHHNGNITRYFIARNTWGEGWGENGFVRIQRGDGQKGTPGICGLAQSPSVALGGLLLNHERGFLREFEGSQYPDDFPAQNFCAHMGYTPGSSCGRVALWTDSHKALTLAMFGLLSGLFLLWPLTSDVRRRRRRRRERMLAREAEGHNRITTESTTLISGNDATQYGSA